MKIFSRTHRPRRRRRPLSAGRVAAALRRIAAVAAITAMTLALVFGGTALALDLQWITRVQIVPVALSVSLTMIVFWLLLTMLFGRIYCSVVCPMGVLMDIFARLRRPTRRAALRHSYNYQMPRNGVRYVWLALVVLTAAVGIPVLLSLFDPYAAFARIATYLTLPLKGYGREFIAGSAAGIAVAAVTLIVVAFVAAMSGRTICNTICPVGSTLSLVSRHSLYGFDINTDACIGCGLCGRVCKAHCIDTSAHTVDMSRCVVCFDCVDICDSRAINYTRHRHRLATPLMIRTPARNSAPAATFDAPANCSNEPMTDSSRRKFLVAGLTLAAAPAVMSAARKFGSTEAILPHQDPTTGLRPVTPPGIASLSAFLSKCVGCGACIAACPAKVIRPSDTQYGYSHPLRPYKDYDASYCRYDCTICTHTCPTGALLPLTPEAKHNFSVGLAHVDPEACIGCGLCARNCPRQTITMAQRPNGHRRVAVVNRDGCIGCGECQYICPATPVRAITVNGLQS